MPKKETKILVIVLVLLDILSIGAFIYLFSFTKNLIVKSVNIENEIKTELSREEVRTLMKGDIAQGKMYQSEFMNYVVPAGGTVDFIKILEQLVANSDLKYDIKSVTNAPYDKGNPIGAEYLKINMEVIGEWKNIQFFLTTLENYPLKIDINKVTLNKFSDFVVMGKTIPQWSGNFDFTVVKIKDTK